MASVKEQVEQLKTKGNEALAAGNNAGAVEAYSAAIALDPANHVLYSNRSAAHAKANEWEKALEDANKTVEINPKWSRGYSRKGAALHGLARFEEAIAAYKEGLALEPGSATFQTAIAEVEKARDATKQDAGAIFGQFANFFSRPMMNTMSMYPQVQAFINDPTFQQKADAIRTNPSSMLQHLQDKNIMTYVSLCSQMQAGGPFGGANAMDVDEQIPSKPAPSKPSKPEVVKEPEPELTEAQKQVLDLKTRGNAAYTARKFDEALALYKEALEVEPKNVNLLVNCTAVYFEKGEYDKCITACEEAIALGRDAFADYKLMARAMARIGNAQVKLGNHQAAIEWYNKSLTEHRDPVTLKSLRDLEKKLEDDAKKAYINPELAAKAKDEGNVLFKAQRFPEAVQCYNEAIKRDPSNPAYLTNRAVAYNKLGEYPSAVKDCDSAIELDPKFSRAFLRKGQAYQFMREFTKSMEAFERGLQVDPDNQELNQAYQKVVMLLHGGSDSEPKGTPEEILAKAMSVPEVREIMQDQAMQQILQQMTSDPSAAAEHMKNPEIRRRINILRAHGVIKTN